MGFFLTLTTAGTLGRWSTLPNNEVHPEEQYLMDGQIDGWSISRRERGLTFSLDP